MRTTEYHITQHIPLKTYRHYCDVMHPEVRKKARTDSFKYAGAMGILLVVSIWSGAYFLIVFSAVTAALFLIFNDAFWRRNIRRSYNENKMISQGEQKLTFLDEAFIVHWEDHKGSYPYKKLKHVISENDAFYLMPDDNNGQIVLKSACSPELISFLESKTWIDK